MKQALFVCFLGLWLNAAAAADNTLLIQQGPQGFLVWHTEGPSRLPEEELLELAATAQPGGGPIISSSLGRAQVFEQPVGVLIRLLDAARDRELLVDRDACGHLIVWHSEGETKLSEQEIFDAVHSALPEGGPRLRFGDRYAKAFLGKLGVMVTLWPAPARR